jgi:hypothetical protein
VETSGRLGGTAAQRWVLGLSALASLLVVLDALVLTTALSAIRVDLGASLEELEWTVNSHCFSFAVLLMTAAALDDRFGRSAALWPAWPVRRGVGRLRARARCRLADCGARTVQGMGVPDPPHRRQVDPIQTPGAPRQPKPPKPRSIGDTRDLARVELMADGTRRPTEPADADPVSLLVIDASSSVALFRPSPGFSRTSRCDHLLPSRSSGVSLPGRRTARRFLSAFPARSERAPRRV